MNTEQFGQLLQMVGQAGEGAFALAVTYMLVGVLKASMIPATLIGGVACITKTVRYCSDRDVEKEERSAYGHAKANLDWHCEHTESEAT